jgi:hypothetical protein
MLKIVPGDGFVFVYSIAERSSFNELLDIHEMLDRVTDGANKPVMLLGNKADLEAQRMVTRESGKQMVRGLCVVPCCVLTVVGAGRPVVGHVLRVQRQDRRGDRRGVRGACPEDSQRSCDQAEEGATRQQEDAAEGMCRAVMVVMVAPPHRPS